MPANTTPLFEIANPPATTSKLPDVVSERLSILRARIPMIALGLVISLGLASAALVLIGPSYTGRAMIQFNFVREEATKDAKIAPTASVDATAVLNNAAPIIRSPATVAAVVSRFDLDSDPAFARGSLLWQAFSRIRSLFGFKEHPPSAHDLAEQQLMGRISVTSDPRSYLVSISVTASNPEWATTLANAVALEYLRGQLLQQVTESYAAAEREMSDMSAIYGVRHPSYQAAKTKVETLRSRLLGLRETAFDESTASRVTGQSFVAAQKVMIPSGPNIMLVLGITAFAELGVGTWLALQPWRWRRATA